MKLGLRLLLWLSLLLLLMMVLLGRRLGGRVIYNNGGLGLGAVFLPACPEFFVGLVGLVHERVSVVKWWCLEHAFQHGHVLDLFVLASGAGANAGRGAARTACTRGFVGFFGTGFDATVARRIELPESWTLRL